MTEGFGWFLGLYSSGMVLTLIGTWLFIYYKTKTYQLRGYPNTPEGQKAEIVAFKQYLSSLKESLLFWDEYGGLRVTALLFWHVTLVVVLISRPIDHLFRIRPWTRPFEDLFSKKLPPKQETKILYGGTDDYREPAEAEKETIHVND